MGHMLENINTVFKKIEPVNRSGSVITGDDGKQYGLFSYEFRDDGYGLSVINHIIAPPGKAWKLVATAPELGEDVFVLKGAYYDTDGRIIAGPGTFMFNKPGAVHGGIIQDALVFVHWCSGKHDFNVSNKLIDFEPKEFPEPLF